MSSPALLHLLAQRAKRTCGAAGSEPLNASGSEAAAGAPDQPTVASIEEEQLVGRRRSLRVRHLRRRSAPSVRAAQRGRDAGI
jgi:hypothetical protein